MSAELSARSVSETDKVDKVRALQRVLYRSAKQDPARRFHALYDKVARSDILWRAWVEVANNQGAPGVDGVTIASIDDGGVVGVGVFLDGLADELRDKTYRPRPLRRVHIPKPGQPGVTRPLGIPCVADRVVMTAAKFVLEPIFEADFSRSVSGSARSVPPTRRWKRSGWRQPGSGLGARRRHQSVFRRDRPDALMGQVERRVSDGEMLKLLRCWLRAGVFEGGLVSDTETGTPQGSPISPLLANIALHVLDEAWAASGQPGDAGPLLRRLRRPLPPAGAGPKRPSVGSRWCWPDSGCGCIPTRPASCASEGEDGFDFLGFHHRKTPSKWGGRRYLSKWPSTRAMASVRAKVRERTDRRFASRDLHDVVADLNPVLRGWGDYFRYGNSNRKFAAIDSYVHWRMSKLASVKYATRGRLPVHPVQLRLAHRPRHLSAHRNSPILEHCACLTMNGVGEPCAGEPHARFDRGGREARASRPRRAVTGRLPPTLLSATRESAVVREVLGELSGILISDFYGGYDAVSCRQQKCLVHLIRDLNNELWRRPFDSELEAFVLEVRNLVVPILEAANKYGLKKRHLGKFAGSVDSFYERAITSRSYRSEPVRTYQKRLRRYRQSLFTFLEYDGIPWNNNMGERALRHLTVQRKISGSFYESLAPAYLLLLGLAQTCRFQDKSF